MTQTVEAQTALLREISIRKEAKQKELENMEREQATSMLVYPLNLGEDLSEDQKPTLPAEPAPASPGSLLSKPTAAETPSVPSLPEGDKGALAKVTDAGSQPTQLAKEDAAGNLSSLKTLRSLATQHSHMLLVRSSRKVVLTEDWKAAREERKTFLILQRIDELKKEGLWSLHQIKKHEAPPRKKVHWDFLLEEMEWLSVDFREERKWKQALAFVASKAIMEYHTSTDKKSLQSKFQKRRAISDDNDDDTTVSPSASFLYYTPTEELPHFETVYQPLVPTNDDQLIREDTSLTPASAILLKKLRRRDEEDYDGTSSFHEPSIKRLCPLLPGSELYYSKKHSQGIFSSSNENGVPSEEATDKPQEESKAAPSSSSSSSSQPLAPINLRTLIPPKVLQQGEGSENWTPGEDRELVESASLFNQNWDLVADCINTKRRHLWGPKRTPSECFLRLQKLQKDPKKFATVLNPPSTEKKGAEDHEEAKRKLVNQFSVYDHVKRIGGIKSQYAIPPPPQKKISLNAHESHAIAASEAGVNINAKPLTPSEIAQRIAHQLLNQQMQSNPMMAPPPPQFGQTPHQPFPQNPHPNQPPQPTMAHPPPGGHMMGAPPMPMGVSHSVPMPMGPGGHMPPSPVPMNRPPPGPQPGPGPLMGHPQHMGVPRGMPLGRGRGGNFGSNTPPNGGTPGPMEMASPVLSATSSQPPFNYPPNHPDMAPPGSPPRMFGRGRGAGGDPNANFGRPPQMAPVGPDNLGQIPPNMGGNPNFVGQNGRPMMPGGMPPQRPHPGNLQSQIQQGSIPAQQHNQQLQQQLQQLKQLQQMQQMQQRQQYQRQQHQQPIPPSQQQPFSPVGSPAQPPDFAAEMPQPAPQVQGFRQSLRGPQAQPNGPRAATAAATAATSSQPASPSSPAPTSPSEETPKKGKGPAPKGKTPAKGKPGPKGGAGTPK